MRSDKMQTLVRIKHLKQERMRYVRNLRFKISQMIRLIDSFTSVHYHITLKFEHYCKILAKFLSVANESLPSNANKCLVFHSFKFQVHEHPSFSCWWHNDTHSNLTWLRHLSMALHWIDNNGISYTCDVCLGIRNCFSARRDRETT